MSACDSGGRNQNLDFDWMLQNPDGGGTTTGTGGGGDMKMSTTGSTTSGGGGADMAGQPMPTCTDSQEPNNARAAAKRLTPGAQSGLTSCLGDEDWFVIALQKGEILDVNVDSASANLLGLTVHEATQGAAIAKAPSGSTGLSLNLQPGLAGDYYVRVTGAGNATYDLALMVSPATGTCAAGTHKQNGTCVKDGCEDLGFEDNQTVADASSMVPGRYNKLRICDANDRDFYAVQAPPGGGLVTVSLLFKHSLGDLSLYLTDGTVSGGYLQRLGGSDGQEDNEFVVNLLRSDDSVFYIMIDGATANDYDLDVVVDPINPQRDCVTGCNMLVQMSATNPIDPSLPEAIASGFYVGTETKYSYARRDLAMWLEWAFAEMVKKFPGVKPVYLSDCSNSQGATPGSETGYPRHPTTTHVNGRDVDIAYYQTLPDNDYRIICGDGSDTNGNGCCGDYNDGNFCTTSTNVVNMKQQTIFLGLLAGHPMFRIVGVDQTLAPQIRAKADELVTSGEMPAWAAHILHGNQLGYGAAGGWQFHHHHIHLSLEDF